jgi:hypothetical protein
MDARAFVSLVVPRRGDRALSLLLGMIAASLDGIESLECEREPRAFRNETL